MKTTVKRGDDTQKIDYPCLMMSRVSGNVVLFTSKGKGMCVHKGDSGWNVGCYTELWDMNAFNPFNGTVTLENE